MVVRLRVYLESGEGGEGKRRIRSPSPHSHQLGRPRAVAIAQ